MEVFHRAPSWYTSPSRANSAPSLVVRSCTVAKVKPDTHNYDTSRSYDPRRTLSCSYSTAGSHSRSTGIQSDASDICHSASILPVSPMLLLPFEVVSRGVASLAVVSPMAPLIPLTECSGQREALCGVVEVIAWRVVSQAVLSVSPTFPVVADIPVALPGLPEVDLVGPLQHSSSPTSLAFPCHFLCCHLAPSFPSLPPS